MAKSSLISEAVEEVIGLARFSLLFSRVERATFHEDGRRRETDADHTVMLGLVAWAIADRFYPHFDTNLITKFALIHDLVEAYSGDTPTLKLTASERVGKEKKEKAALQRITKEFASSFPNLPKMLLLYERREVPEARFVKAVDKAVPKITHILNQGESLRNSIITIQEAQATYAKQRVEMNEYASDFPELLEIREQLIDQMMSTLQKTMA